MFIYPKRVPKVLLTILLFVILIIQTKITSAQSEDINFQNEIYTPIAIGNMWKYKEEWPAGIYHAAKKMTSISEIISCEKNEEGIIYKTRNESYGDVEENRGMGEYKRNSNGLFAISKDKETGELREFMRIKFPIEEGQSWKIGSDYPAEEVSTTGEIIGTNLEVSVPAGTFTKCIKVQTTTTNPPLKSFTDRWYAPEIGMIQEIMYIWSASAGQKVVWKKSLISYKVGSKVEPSKKINKKSKNTSTKK
jgi:hypothetical protein